MNGELVKKDVHLFFVLLFQGADLSDLPGSAVQNMCPFQHIFRFRLVHNDDIPDAAVENLEHFRPGQLALLAQPFEYRGHIPGAEVDPRARVFRQNAGDVIVEAAPRDVNHALGADALQKLFKYPGINHGGLKQHVTKTAIRSGEHVVGRSSAGFKQLAHQRVAVGMNP